MQYVTLEAVQQKSVEWVSQLLVSLRKESWIRITEHGLSAVTLLIILRYLKRNGMKKIFQNILSGALKSIPGAQATVNGEIEKEVDKAIVDLFKRASDVGAKVPAVNKMPKKGIPKDELLRMMKTLFEMDTDPSKGKVWAYVYETAEGKEFEDVIKQAHNMFMNKNALNPFAFPSLRRFENEVVKMSIKMLNGDENARGNMTSGGTESIIAAVKTYRDRARDLFGITEPEMILPISAHAAFDKAGHMLNVKVIHVPLQPDFRGDVSAMKKAITKNTILLVGSAPSYPHGAMDPIEEIAALAKTYRLPVHVDSCIGGFLLPWAKKLGYDIPKFDFSVDGVTSISADVHKYGYSAKGASVVLYKNADYRKYQYYVYTEWPGGLFGSPSMLGTRGGGSIAGAWAALCYLGEEGFLRNTKVVMDTAKYLAREISATPGLYILGNPAGSLLSFSSKEFNVFAVADVLEDKFGWNMERQQKPDCIHLTVMPQHVQSSETFISNLRDAVQIVKTDPGLVKKGTAALYGLVAKIPSNDLIESFITSLLGKVYA